METRKSKKYREKTFEFNNNNVVNLTRTKPKNGNMEFDFDYYESDREEKKISAKSNKSGRIKYNTLDMQKLIINVCLTCVLGIALVFVIVAIMSYLEDKEYNDSIKSKYRQSYEIELTSNRVNGEYKKVLSGVRYNDNVNNTDKNATSKVPDMEKSVIESADYVVTNEYQLSKLYTSNNKDFKAKYNNKIILIEKALVNEVGNEGKYITLGTLDKLSNTNIIVEINKDSLRETSKTLNENSIVKVQGKLKVKDNNNLIIKCSNIKELNSKDSSVKKLSKIDIIGISNLLDKIFINKDLTILNGDRFTLKGSVASMVEFSTGDKGIILDNVGYTNVNVICILDSDYYNQWQILNNANINNSDAEMIEIIINGNIGLSQYKENDTELFNVFINNAIIEINNK